MSDMDRDAQAAARARRQARIRAGARDRLAKITGSAGSQDFHKPSTLVHSNTSQRQPAHAHQDPPVSVPLAEGPSLSDGLLTALTIPSDMEGAGGSLRNPLLALLAGPSSSQPQPQQPQSKTSQLWAPAHFAANVLVALYVAFRPDHLLRAFCTIQILLQCLRIFVDPPRGGWLSSVVSLLPAPSQRLISAAGTNVQVARDVYRDFGTMLFVYGMCGMGASGPYT